MHDVILYNLINNPKINLLEEVVGHVDVIWIGYMVVIAQEIGYGVDWVLGVSQG